MTIDYIVFVVPLIERVYGSPILFTHTGRGHEELGEHTCYIQVRTHKGRANSFRKTPGLLLWEILYR